MKAGWLVVVAACAQTRSASLSSSARDPAASNAQPAPRARVILMARPPIDMSVYLPDFHDDLRWPLLATQHPTFEPSYDVAGSLADAGVTWQQLCERGAQNRSGGNRDLIAYLRGWCKALEGNVDEACATLMPLEQSTAISNFDDVIRTDLANILANAGHADAAEHLINKHHIQDTALLDRLAANYVEVGTTHDALQINLLALGAADRATPAIQCRRLTRQIALLHDRDRSSHAKLEAPGDPTCVELYNKVGCWADLMPCEPYAHDAGLPDKATKLIDAYRTWTDAVHDPARWGQVAQDAAEARGLPGGPDLAVAALENSERTSTICDNYTRGVASFLLKTVELSSRVDLQSRVDDVSSRCNAKAQDADDNVVTTARPAVRE